MAAGRRRGAGAGTRRLTPPGAGAEAAAVSVRPPPQRAGRLTRPAPEAAAPYAKTPSGSNEPFSTAGESSNRSHSSIIVA